MDGQGPTSVNAMVVIEKLKGRLGVQAYEASVAEAQVEQLMEENAQLTQQLSSALAEKAQVEATLQNEVAQLREEISKLTAEPESEAINISASGSGEDGVGDIQ